VPTAQRGQAAVEIAAASDLVYDLITDVARMGEWSPECYRCEWLDAATAAVRGGRFRGYNRLGRLRWERTAVVDTAERGHEFGFTTINDRTGRRETQWRYTMQPSASGTLLTESLQFRWCSVWNRAAELFLPRGRQVARRSGSAPSVIWVTVRSTVLTRRVESFAPTSNVQSPLTRHVHIADG
jgi:Polyketide cyclase / dehydrase and lipid transport